MHVYKGFPQRTNEGGYLVTKDGQPLDPGPSQKLYNHSPDGFAWGYRGSGPSQLALALLFDVTGDPQLAEAFYQDFKEEMIATIAGDSPWVMLEHTIRAWVNQRQILERLHSARRNGG